MNDVTNLIGSPAATAGLDTSSSSTATFSSSTLGGRTTSSSTSSPATFTFTSFSMIGNIVRRSSLNTFGSICYCVTALCVHVYAAHSAVARYRESEGRQWPGRAGKPVESGALLGMTVISLLIMPVFCVACFFRMGNLANDGVKLGRDHALVGGASGGGGRACGGGDKEGKGGDRGGKAMPLSGRDLLRRAWRHCCPLSQTLHVIAAFLLLLPDTLLTAAEVKHEYKSTDTSWMSEMDFLFPAQRAFLSDVRSIVNVSEFSSSSNASHQQQHVLLPTSATSLTHLDWRGDHTSVSVAFANLVFALLAFLVRYASVFWFTNKALTLVFAVQLLAMLVTSVFSYSCFSVLYCVCYNASKYPNVRLSVACSADLVLYLLGSLILLLSSMSVFEYGSHYFHEKFKIVERHHDSEVFVKQTSLLHGGGSNHRCQGYVPHVVAMATLMALAVCKAPLLYDLVSLMRLTEDPLLLTAVVCEVCYMVLWVLLWFGLTVKQQWQFRILDYVPLKQPPLRVGAAGASGSDETSSDKSSGAQLTPGEMVDVANYIRNKRISPLGASGGGGDGGSASHRYSDPLPAGVSPLSGVDDPSNSELGTDESDAGNNVDVVMGLDGNPLVAPQRSRGRSRQKRNGGQRVTFESSVRGRAGASGGVDCDRLQTSSLPRHVTYAHARGGGDGENRNLDVRADVHNAQPVGGAHASSNHVDGSSRCIIGAGKERSSSVSDSTRFSRDYRSSIKSKCGEYYSSTSNLSASAGNSYEDPAPLPDPMEPLPTLMSSFRDKVRGSSIAASNLRERERKMMESYNNHSDSAAAAAMAAQNADNHLQETLDLHDVEKTTRRCLSLSDTSSSPAAANNNSAGGGESNKVIYGKDPSLFPSANHHHHHHQHHNNKSNGGSPQKSGFSNKKHSIAIISDGLQRNGSLDHHELSLHEDLQMGRLRHSSGGGGGGGQSHRKEDYHLGMVGGGRMNSSLRVRSRDPLPLAVSGSMHPLTVLGKAPLPPGMTPRPLHVVSGVTKKAEIGRRDSANYSLTSSQDTSSNESDHGGQGLCSQV